MNFGATFKNPWRVCTGSGCPGAGNSDLRVGAVLLFHVPPISLQQGARVFGALGPIGPSSPGLVLGGLAVGGHRLSNKLLAWSGVLEWQEVSVWEWGLLTPTQHPLTHLLIPNCRNVGPSQTPVPS